MEKAIKRYLPILFYRPGRFIIWSDAPFICRALDCPVIDSQMMNEENHNTKLLQDTIFVFVLVYGTFYDCITNSD